MRWLEFLEGLHFRALWETTTSRAGGQMPGCVWPLEANALSGATPELAPGSWTRVERSAADSVRAAVLRKGADDRAQPALSLSEWQKEMRGKQVGYTGEELSTCHKLSWDQILPALPLKNMEGASILYNG